MKQKHLGSGQSRVPKPPHPVNRREPLPWQCPKPPEEDPQAPLRVQVLLASASYRRPDLDLDFLARDSMRSVRLEIDFAKPEILLKEHHIGHTIVVFGSTRICEPAAAQRKVDELKATLVANTANKDLARRLAIAERVLAKSHYYEVAREFGRLVGSSQTADQIKPAVQKLGGIGPGQPYFDPTAFAPVTDARFGTSGRNILRGPGLVNLDASLFRNFRFGERIDLQFRAEAFNVSNTPHFSNPSSNVSSGGFMVITSALSTSNNVEGGERQFRFALRVSF